MSFPLAADVTAVPAQSTSPPEGDRPPRRKSSAGSSSSGASSIHPVAHGSIEGTFNISQAISFPRPRSKSQREKEAERRRLSDEGISQLQLSPKKGNHQKAKSEIQRIINAQCLTFNDYLRFEELQKTRPHEESYDHFDARELDFSNCHATNQQLRYFIENHDITHVVRANFSRCTNLTTVALSKLGERCPNLSYLDITHCNLISYTSIYAFLRAYPTDGPTLTGCTPLQTLILDKCPDIEDNSLVQISKFCRGLIHFSITHNPAITNEGIKEIVNPKNCPRLTHVNINGAKKIDRTALRVIAQSCRKLMEFHFWQSAPSNVNANTHEDLSAEICEIASLRHLIVLETDAILNDQNLTELIERNKNFKTLQLRGMLDVTDQGIQALHQCKNLHTLYLHDCPRLTSKGLKRLFENLPILKEFYIYRNDSLDDESMCALNSTPTLIFEDCMLTGEVFSAPLWRQCLSVLSFISCENISDPAISNLPWALSSLTLSGSNKITSNQWLHLGNNGPERLKELSINHRHQSDSPLTEAALRAMGTRFKLLKRLDLSYHAHLPPNTLTIIGEPGLFPELSYLNVYHCPTVDINQLKHLQDRTGLTIALEERRKKECEEYFQSASTFFNFF